jgi:hypothetical protein
MNVAAQVGGEGIHELHGLDLSTLQEVGLDRGVSCDHMEALCQAYPESAEALV